MYEVLNQMRRNGRKVWWVLLYHNLFFYARKRHTRTRQVCRLLLKNIITHTIIPMHIRLTVD